MENQFILVITGPPGVGKTTISKKIAAEKRLDYISGDEIKEKLFPDVEDVTEFPEKLTKVKQEIINETHEKFREGKSAVVDYVVLGKEYIKQFRDRFNESFRILVLFPKKEDIHLRNKSRECWTTDDKSIEEIYEKYDYLRDFIGSENYVDTTNEAVEETLSRILEIIK